MKEENTSYLYMELKKEQTDEYITIGMGLRGKKGQPVSFWGFTLKDGKRVGKDFLLYKELDNKIPLTKQELKVRIGNSGQFVETQKDYMKMVNDNIFGFKTNEEYEEFIKLLIEIRTPKLSNGKEFKPTVVTEIIKSSLQGLSDEDLRPVADSIESMNKTNEQLEELKISKKAVDNLQKSYKEYNECSLYQKTRKFVDNKENLENKEKEFKKLSKSIQENEKEKNINKEKLEKVETDIITNSFKLDELRKDKRFNLQKELNDEENNYVNIEKEINLKKEKVEIKKQEQRKKELELKENENIYEIEVNEFNNIEKEASKMASDINYDEYEFNIDDIKNKLNKKYNYDSINKNIKNYIEKIENGKALLEKFEMYEKDYDNMVQLIDKKRQELNGLNNDTTKNRIELEDVKNIAIEEVYKWELENTIFKISDEDKKIIAEKIENFGIDTNYDEIFTVLRNSFDKSKSEILGEKVKYEFLKKDIQKEILELKSQINIWENKKELEPIREDRIIENRERLKENNIEFLPLFSVIEFRKNVSEKMKNIIETSLNDMGILDALIISKDSISKIKELDEKFVDKYLLGDKPAFGRTLLDVFEIVKPEDSKISISEISNVLMNISLDETVDGSYVLEDGSYKIGILQGKVENTILSSYIGKKAKKRYKENYIIELMLKQESKEKELSKNDEYIRMLNINIDNLEKEFNNLQIKNKLQDTYNNLEKSILNIENISEQIKLQEKDLEIKQQKLKDIKEQIGLETKGIFFDKTLLIFKENLDIARDLKDIIFEMQKFHNNISNIYDKSEILKENLEILNDDLDNMLYEFSKIKVTKNQLEEKIKAIKEMIGHDFSEIKDKMELCLNLEKELPIKKEELVKIIIKLETKNESIEERLKIIESELEVVSDKNSILKDILLEEINLKYVDLNELDLEQLEENIDNICGQILTKLVKYEKSNKTLNEYLGVMLVKYRENLESLVEYNLAVEQMYQNEEDNKVEFVNPELKEAYSLRNRMDIKCFLKGKKVNLIVLSKDINDSIEITASLIDKNDREIFENILTNTISRKIREKIDHSKEWVKNMNNLMENLKTSSGLSFSLKWKPKSALDESELDTSELVNIFNTDISKLGKEDIKKFANHFRGKLAKVEAKHKEKGNIVPFYTILKDALDYRNWYEFEFMYKQGINERKVLTNNAFFKLSGGEKAMAMYIPLFAAVYARYEAANTNTLRIISLDEAFAGVDDNNIRDMFRILTELKIDYIINSQVLWGEYDTIPSLAINELISDSNNQIVSVIRYIWNGYKKELVS